MGRGGDGRSKGGTERGRDCQWKVAREGVKVRGAWEPGNESDSERKSEGESHRKKGASERGGKSSERDRGSGGECLGARSKRELRIESAMERIKGAMEGGREGDS